VAVSAIGGEGQEYEDKNTNLSQVTNKLYIIKLDQVPYTLS